MNFIVNRKLVDGNTPIPPEEALSGQVKTGHMWSLENRPWDVARDLDVVLCLSLSGQV